MQIIDSHCHIDKLDLDTFGGSVAAMIEKAADLGVTQFLCVSINLENYPKILQLAKHYPQIYASVGVHPTEIDGKDPNVADLVSLGKSEQVIAIGETGLDYFHLKRDEADWQRERFVRHIKAGKELGKPIIIHSRNARDDTLAMMRQHQPKSGVMHCFVEDYQSAKKYIDLGFYISFSGIVTFKNAQQLQEVAKKIPLDAMLVETDAPYLTPAPYRGKPNMPGYTYYVAKHIAKLRGINLADVAHATTANFKRLFLNL